MIHPRWVRSLRAAAAPLRRHLAAVLVGAATLSGVTVMTLADGFSVNSFTLGTGTVWVASSGPGQLALLDGSSGEVAVKLAVASPGSDLLAVQGSSAGYAINRTAGSIVRVDAARWTTSDAVQLIKDASGGLSAVATDQAMYAIDGDRGLVQEADPATLQPRGAPRSLSATPAPGSPVVDKHGVMWLLDARSGDLVRVAGQVDRTAAGIAASSTARLVLADGSPVVVDPAAGTAIPVDPSSGEPDGDGACVDANRQDASVRVGGSTSSPEIFAVSGADGVLRITDLNTGRCDQAVPGIAAPGSNLGVPVEVSRHVFVPNFTDGVVVVIDLDTLGLTHTDQIVGPGSDFDLLDRDGFVFYNDRASERAGVVRIDGSVRTIAKYDVADPGNGVHVPEPEQDPVQVAAAVESAVSSQSSVAATAAPTPTSNLADPTTTPTHSNEPTTRGAQGGGNNNSVGDSGGGTGGTGGGTGGAGGGTGGAGGGTGGAGGGVAAGDSPTDTAVTTASSGTPGSNPPSSTIASGSEPALDPVSSSSSGPSAETVQQHVDSRADLQISIPEQGITGEPITSAVSTTAGTEIASATWSFGDGTDPTDSPTHTWTAPGTYNVLVRVIRASGDQENGGAQIIISKPVDVIKPEWLTVPKDKTVSAVSASGATVSFDLPTARDAGSEPRVGCDPASGDQFKLGPTKVTCTATDDAENVATTSFTVSVIDDEAPTLVGMPPNKSFTIPVNDDAVSYDFTDPTAQDNVDPDPRVTCDHPGTFFAGPPLAVTCEAVDAAGNKAHDNFSVTVTRFDGCDRLAAEEAGALAEVADLQAELSSAAPGQKAGIVAQIKQAQGRASAARQEMNKWGCP